MRLGYKHEDQQQDIPNIGDLSNEAKSLIKLMSDDPFITQSAIAKKFNWKLEQHKLIVAEVRNSKNAQDYILTQGNGSKYWSNTIAPLLASGSLQSAIDQVWRYPNRVGLYTGLSCMFYCGFCGRNPTAKYESHYAEIGRDLFYQTIDQDPKTDPVWHDRFRISGGLEPLTNPYLGDIITYGKNRGFKMQLYTNGNMLTSKYINQNPGMLDLEAVRISLYGTTAEKAFAVTKNKHSFNNIIENVITYLNAASTTKVGLNWIILPGHTKDVLELLEVIDTINSRANRPINFVTLREDFSQNIRVISDQEKTDLMNIFQDVETFKSTKYPSVHFDYGYALDPLRKGLNLGNLKMINWDEMVPANFPQVSVAVDVKGDVYVYHESGFLDRPGSERYIIGNIRNSSVEEVTRQFVESRQRIKPLPTDVGFLDAFDHVVSILINQANSDKQYGLSWEQGPVVIRS